MRPMRREDLDQVMVIENELFGAESWSEAMFAGELDETATRYYLVEESDGVISAYAGLCAYAPHEAYVQTIAVIPPARRRGIGTALLKVLIDETTKRGVDHLDLEVRSDNDAARRLYERHGFREIAVRRNYYQPSGTDAIVMRKGLAP
jgi:[ribosomal protein S18]-alanine N-acetyltransferase